MIANIVKIIKQCARHPVTITGTVEWTETRRNMMRAGLERRGRRGFRTSIAENGFGKSQNKQAD